MEQERANQPIEQCGFCGRFFRGLEFIDIEELKTIDQNELNKASMGYCPDAPIEAGYNQEDEHRQITRDMAIDGGDPSLEGQWI